MPGRAVGLRLRPQPLWGRPPTRMPLAERADRRAMELTAQADLRRRIR